MEPLALVAFGATVADMDPAFIKVGGVWDNITSWMQEHPELTGGVGGGLMGLLAAKGMSQKGDPYAGQKYMLGLLLGAGGGAMLGHYLPGWFGWGAHRASPVRPTGDQPTKAVPVAKRMTLPPIREVGGPSPEVGGASIPATQVEPRTQSTEQQIRQQGAQQLAEQAQQVSTAREHAALERDQGRVVERIRALTAPRQTVSPEPGGVPRNIIIHPGRGVRQLWPPPKGIHGIAGPKRPIEGLKTAEAEKTALDTGDLQRAFDEVKDYLKRNPWPVTAAGGAALGAGLGWATNDPETRRRKMLMGLISGGLLGGAGGVLGGAALRSMSNISSAAKAVQQAGEAAEGMASEGTRQMGNLEESVLHALRVPGHNG